jgi:preprotein translocase subunit SecG
MPIIIIIIIIIIVVVIITIIVQMYGGCSEGTHMWSRRREFALKVHSKATYN